MVNPVTANGALAAEEIRAARLKVWIDPDLCTGDGLCTDIAPPIFEMGDDGIAYVKDGDEHLHHPEEGPEPLANIPAGQEKLVVEAAEECPGECIFIAAETPGGIVDVPLESAIEAFGR
ncbi:MAG: ferredoxin [Acidimicrobiia bacterium]